MSAVTFPSSGVLVTEAGSHVLTNKDYDGGTASNTSRLTVPQDTLANLNALTRKEATLVYANDVDKLYVDNGSALLSVGSFSPPLVTRYLSGSGTHNVNANTKYLRVRMVGGGGGGGGNNTTSGASAGGAGGDTTFGTAVAKGGTGGRAANPNAAPSGTNAPDYVVVNIYRSDTGQSGGKNPSPANGALMSGGKGGSSFLGGGGQGNGGGDGFAALANTGGGGGGASSGPPAFDWAGSGGNSGEGIEFIISNPLPSYSYAVGSGGASGVGTHYNGGPGGSGVLIVEEYS
jgi:hypothetical protein